MMRSFFLHQFLDLVEKLRCRRAVGKPLPLEYKRFTIKNVQFTGTLELRRND